MLKHIALVIGLPMCAVHPCAAEPLTKTEIVALISGKSANWQTVDGKIKGTIGWAADGSQVVTGNFPEFSEDAGKWRVKGNKLCSKWTKIRSGEEKCDAMELQDGSTYRVGNSLVSF